MVWFIILAVITGVLALGLPPDPQTLQQLHITSVAYRIAVLVLLIPYGVIWYAAFYAYAKLKEYTHAIKGSEDGKAFHKIMVGMGVLAFSLIIPTAISLIISNIATHHHGFKPASVVIDNYLPLSGLAAFIFIGNGTRLLANASKNRPGLTSSRLFALLFITISVAFAYFVFRFHAHHPHVYYLNSFFLMFTFIIPFLFGWFAGLVSAYEFGMYAKNVNGLLYKRALNSFAYGITVTIAGSVAIEFLDNTFVLAKASHSLSSLIVFEYLLLIFIAVGLILMALGTNKLKRIEEV